MRKFQYSSKYKSIFNKLSARYGIPPEEIEEYVDEFFMRLKFYITHETVPEIQITNFGTFKASRRNINRSLKKSIYWFKRGSTSRESVIKRIKQVWPIRNRLGKRKLGLETWKEWNKKRREINKLDKRSLEEKLGIKK